MLDPADPAFNHPKLISLYASLCGTQSGLYPLLLDYNALRRLLNINDEEISARGEDVLAPIVTTRLREICKEPGDLLDPNMSLAALAEAGPVPRSYQGRCLLIFNLRDRCSLAGCCICCKFMIDETIGTSRFGSDEYLLKNSLPTDLTSYLLVDVICSKTPPSALLSILYFFRKISQTRSNKLIGIAAICVNKSALNLFVSLGFKQFQFREKGSTRWLVHLRTEALEMARVASRLKFDGSDLLFSYCYRRGLTKRTEDRILARC